MPANVLVVLTDPGSAGLSGAAREALAAAFDVAAHTGGGVSVLLSSAGGAAATEAAERGAAHVFLAAAPNAEAAVAAAAEAARLCDARVVIVSRGAGVLDVVPRLAARLNGGCVMGVTEIGFEDGDIQPVAAIYGGAARAVYRFRAAGPRVLSLAPTAAEPPAVQPGRSAPVQELAVSTDTRVRVVEPPKPAEGPRLEDARVVVSGGRGLKDRENFALIRELAAALGGLPGASRAIVDESWATSAQQVGLTGKIVTPDLYVAAGISGASQHMAGCSNARTIVAINTDSDAPIFRYAHFGIVGDCLEVLPELVRLARQRAVSG